MCVWVEVCGGGVCVCVCIVKSLSVTHRLVTLRKCLEKSETLLRPFFRKDIGLNNFIVQKQFQCFKTKGTEIMVKVYYALWKNTIIRTLRE